MRPAVSSSVSRSLTYFSLQLLCILVGQSTSSSSVKFRRSHNAFIWTGYSLGVCRPVSQLITVDSTTSQAFATCKRVKPRLSRRSRNFCPSVILHPVSVFQSTLYIELTIYSHCISVGIRAKSHDNLKPVPALDKHWTGSGSNYTRRQVNYALQRTT